MSMAPLHSVSVAGIVVRDDGRILVIQRQDNSHWEPPGGVLELKETFQQGVQREVEEETGVRVQVEHLTGIYKNMDKGVVALVFRCSPESGAAERTDEARAIEWIAPNEVDSRMTNAYAVRFHDALNYKSQPRLRTHDGENLIG